MPRPSPTITELIQRFRSVHGMKYLYSKVIYKGYHSKVEIICRRHGSFFQRPSNHIDGNGCSHCSKEKQIKEQTSNKIEFTKKAKKIHGEKYKYHFVKYQTAKIKVRIICPIHGEFLQTPDKHLQGKGCNDCGIISAQKKQSMTQKDFIKRAKKIHQNSYSYKNTNYHRFHSKVAITCKKHGEFFQTPAIHLKGGGCKKCSIEYISGLRRLSKEEIIEKFNEVHDGLYDYSKVKYKNYSSRVEILCPEHSSFFQSPSNHIAGKGCSKCFIKTEGRIARYLMKRNIVWRQFNIGNKYFDFLLPDQNLIIERDGEQHYRDVDLFARGDKNYLNKQIRNDKLKTKLAKDAGFKIARIPYWLSKKEEEIEIENILAGKPTYPDVPDLKQEKTKPKPVKNT